MSIHNFVGWMAVLATIINILPVSISILLVVSLFSFFTCISALQTPCQEKEMVASLSFWQVL